MSVQYYYEPFFSFSDVNRLFDQAFGPLERDSRRARGDNNGGEQINTVSSFRPRLDIFESKENNIVTATFELPGLKKEDVSIDLQNNHLVVTGETKWSQDKDENGWVVKERRRGKFSRTIPLPQGAKAEDIKASMENGVLTLSFPKVTPEEAAKKITIS